MRRQVWRQTVQVLTGGTACVGILYLVRNSLPDFLGGAVRNGGWLEFLLGLWLGGIVMALFLGPSGSARGDAARKRGKE